MTGSTRRPRLRTALVPAAAVLVALGAWILLGLGGDAVVSAADDLVTAAAASTAAALCLRAQARHTGQMRLFWLTLGGAAGCWALAEIIWGVYADVLHLDVPVPSWADVGYLTAIPLAIVALVVHPAMRASGVHRARWAMDGLVVATALLFLSWTLVLGPAWHASQFSTVGGIVGLAYPFGDVVIVFFIVLAVRGTTGANRRSLGCLLAALLLMALSDSVYTYLAQAGDFDGGTLLDLGWVAAYMGIGLSAWLSDPAEAAAPVAEHRTSLVSLVAPLLPVLVALVVATVWIPLGHRLDHVSWVSMVVLIAIVLLRQVLMVVELFSGGAATAGLMDRLTHLTLSAGKRPPAPEHRA